MSDRFAMRLKWFCFVFPALLLLIGCNESSTESYSRTPSEVSEVAPVTAPAAKPSSYEFEPPVTLTADGETIKVEEPGYACPTLFDIDKDGSQDLIVGQFKGGKMKWYRNLSGPSETPEYAEGEWIKSGDEPAEVPGVS